MATPVSLSKLTVPRLGLASFRRRILFRSAFLLLIAATLALALTQLSHEKTRSYQVYQQGFERTAAEIVAKLRHPSGQLALLNPAGFGDAVTPLRPFVLPFSAIDFDDRSKAQQAIEMAGCAVQYSDGGSVCVAVGNNPHAGGFVYLVGHFYSDELVARGRGVLDLDQVHRARVSVDIRGRTSGWIAPFESLGDTNETTLRGRLTGFVDNGRNELAADARPVRDFRGWLWQSRHCAQESVGGSSSCQRRSFFSIRLPLDVLREALFRKPTPEWPPRDLDQIRVRIEFFAPGAQRPLFDSNASNATPPPSLSEVTRNLLPGETLHIRKAGTAGPNLIRRPVDASSMDTSSPWLDRLIRWLPIEGHTTPLESRATIATLVGNYEVTLSGDLRAIDRSLAIVATRLSWFIAAMLGAIGLAWLVIEVGLIRRIVVLTKRAAAVSSNVQDAHVDRRIGELDVSDLRGSDELGILAGGLADLLQRVKNDVKREHIRAEQERDMWHAVGHEIMSPLQSLMVLHAGSDDPSHRYVQRMQQAVRVLYGTASPSEALEAATVQPSTIDLNEFLHHVASNARFAGIDAVRFERLPDRVLVRANEHFLEDVVTHVLRNADRHRIPGSPINMLLTTSETSAHVAIHNTGAPIDSPLMDRIFEYGVSEPGVEASASHRGQGLFVAKTYMAKMAGTIAAINDDDGVTFTVTLPRVA